MSLLPRLFFYDPFFEAELALGERIQSRPQALAKGADDLGFAFALLGDHNDRWLCETKDAQSWHERLLGLGIQCARPATTKALGADTTSFSLQPWGYHPSSHHALRPFRARAQDPSPWGRWLGKNLQHPNWQEAPGAGVMANVGHKGWATAAYDSLWQSGSIKTHLLAPPRGQTISDVDLACDRIQKREGPLVLKRLWGTSGRGIWRVRADDNLDDALRRWLEQSIARQGGVVIEAWDNKKADRSVQMMVSPHSIQILGSRRFFTDQRWQYRGTALFGSSTDAPNAPRDAWDETLWDCATWIGNALAAEGYEGPVGIDAMLVEDPNDATRTLLRPVVEINPRFTMGRIALALETHLAPGSVALWRLKSAAAQGQSNDETIERNAFGQINTGTVRTTPVGPKSLFATELVVRRMTAKTEEKRDNFMALFADKLT